MSSHFRVVTSNLFRGRADPGAVVRILEEFRPDAFAAQELTPEVADVLGGYLPYGDLSDNPRSRGLGIALRAPAAMATVALPNRDARVAHLDPADWPQLPGPLELVNVHITAPTVPPFWKTFRTRDEEWRNLEAYLAEREPGVRVLVGDLNTPPTWPGYKRLIEFFDDAAEVVARRNATAPDNTWGLWSGSRRLARLDHAFVSGVGVHDVRTVHVEGSDHSALVVDLNFD